ncbi:hypothetical protein [Pedobacter africanus]|uniref:Uncharacterized protein n=1 Tax=Pedobacter africanus TaxID=151894 RepID=A0A1W1ZKA6_9SPHI|nr:hypothetical protein [Pedobacter africanus]SMC48836.1 hypothetical protein SAMN04488524_0808 [Pedobacter africanus]
MEQFRIEVADNDGYGHFFNIKMLDMEHFQIFDDRQQRMATIEIEQEEPHHYRQSLDCKIGLPLLDAIKDSIMLHEELTENQI